jgi:hypothetical protein
MKTPQEAAVQLKIIPIIKLILRSAGNTKYFP